MSVRTRTLLWTIAALVVVSIVLLLVPSLKQIFFYFWLPFSAVVVSLLFERKFIRYLALAIALVLYYGALFKIPWLTVFSPRFNFLIAIIAYTFAFPMHGLTKYIRSRVLQIIILLVIYVTIVFFIFLAMPGDYTTKFLDPRIMKNPEMYERLKQLFGVEDLWYVKYFKHMRNFFNFELGISFMEYPRPVWDILAERLPRTVFLFLCSTISSFLLGFNVGKHIAWRRGGFTDRVATVVGIIFWTIFTPLFMLIMIWLFSVTLKLFPLTGFIDPNKWHGVTGFTAQDVFIKLLWSGVVLVITWAAGIALASRARTLKTKKLAVYGTLAVVILAVLLYWWRSGYGYYALDIVYHVILPVISLTILAFARSMLVMRDTMLEVIREDYITTAKAKGLPDRVVRDKHAARTALLPLITSFVLGLATTVSGGVITETMFSWKGMGWTLLNATLQQDTPLALGALTFTGVFVLVAHLIADVLYAFLDPRIRY
ncbi:MAG TPA: ABC transporter permease [Thermotogae bacterium]|nr:ABC transporter permease [Thermotogota bacterium]